MAEESGRYADLVLTLAFTGLRWGEAIALTVADVEFLKRRISVHRNAVQVGQDFEVGQTKGKEDRIVPVAASVLSRLAARCEGARSPALARARGVVPLTDREREIAVLAAASAVSKVRV